MIEYREGDLFAQPDALAIGHGVNCRGVMGAGVAVLFRRTYPAMFEQYQLWCDAGILTPGTSMPWDDGPHPHAPNPYARYVFNIASQDEPGANANLNWLDHALDSALAQAARIAVRKLAVPRIGAGIGGLKWDDVKDVYERVAQFHTRVDLVVVSLPGADD